MTFALFEPPPPPDFEPRVVVMNADNEVESVMGPLPET
jgi:hypothetical protein